MRVLGPVGARIPAWSVVRAECGLTDAEIARYLVVSLRTVQRWNRTDAAPVPVLLSLFWQTRYGRSEMETNEANWVANYFMKAQIAEREVERLKAVVIQLESERDHFGGAANSPIYRAL